MESIWEKTVSIPSREPLRNDIQTEAAVIGGGLTGILTAFFLQQKGMETVVLEADRIGSGQTGKTTAKITLQHNLLYDRLIRTYGKERAKQYADANRLAMEKYRKLTEEYSISCGLQEHPAYLYSVCGTDKLEKECAAARELGIEAWMTVETELPFPVKAALEFPGQLLFHPLEFLKCLSEQLCIYEKTQVLHVEKDRIVCREGQVRAKHIVFACHYPLQKIRGFYPLRIYQERSYVLALKNAQELEGMYLGVDEESFSFRPFDEYLLLGGAGHRTGDNKAGDKYDRLRRMAALCWPGCQEEAAWSAQDGMTLDGIPYIGPFSRTRPDWYAAFGYGKWGMTSSMAAAMIISDRIVGRENLNSRVFSPQRGLSLPAWGALLKQTGQALKGWTQRIVRPKCSGCSHLGCALSWNPDEKSWDCACHGSRYDRNGIVLDGPARKMADKINREEK